MPESSIGEKLRKVLGLPAPSARPLAAGDRLLAFAEQEFELSQARIMERFPESTKAEGVCLALAGRWLKEKLTTTNGMAGSVKRIRREDRHFHGSRDNADRQEALVKAAAPEQTAYEKTEGSQDVRLDALLARMGLRHDAEKSEQVRQDLPATRDPDTLDAFMDLIPTLAAATSSKHLPPRQGVCISVEVMTAAVMDGEDEVKKAKKGMHAIAAYRSRGDNLHFFDANLGVFKVSKVEEFFDAWEKRYLASGMTVRITRKDAPPSGDRFRTYSYVR